MSKNLLSPVKALFEPARPNWACEFTAAHVIVGGVDSSRRRIVARVAHPFSGEVLAGSLSERNVLDPDSALAATKEALGKAGFRGLEINLVIPDGSSRIAFVTAESLTGTDQEREAFVRWKLKKTVPFDVDSAQVAYRVLGPHIGTQEKGVDIMVALSPKAVVQEYEGLLERLDLHAGFVIPSTLAVLNLLPLPDEDSLFIKVAPDSITTTIFQDRRPRFYRRVARMPIYDAVYPSVLYYQDKLGGVLPASIWICGYDKDTSQDASVIQEKLGVAVRKAEPKNIEDIYKPALGAVDLIWAHST